MTKEQEEQKEVTDDNRQAHYVTKKESAPVVRFNNDEALNTVNFFDDKQLIAAENFLTKIMRSEKGGIKSVNDGLAILMRAQDLKLPFSTCIEHIHVINGKTGVDIHIVKALLSRAGCTWRCLKDYQPLYEYTDGINVYNDGEFPDYVVRCKSEKEVEEKIKVANGNTDIVYVYPVKYYQDFQGTIYKEYQLNDKMVVVISKTQADYVSKQGKRPIFRIPNKPINYVTEYELHRTINGKDCVFIGKFSFNEAIAAGLFEKDTYKKYPRILVGHRAFTLAARDGGSDILFGVMETTELKIVAGRELTDSDTADVEDVEAVEI